MNAGPIQPMQFNTQWCQIEAHNPQCDRYQECVVVNGDMGKIVVAEFCNPLPCSSQAGWFASQIVAVGPDSQFCVPQQYPIAAPVEGHEMNNNEALVMQELEPYNYSVDYFSTLSAEAAPSTPEFGPETQLPVGMTYNQMQLTEMAVQLGNPAIPLTQREWPGQDSSVWQNDACGRFAEDDGSRRFEELDTRVQEIRLCEAIEPREHESANAIQLDGTSTSSDPSVAKVFVLRSDGGLQEVSQVRGVGSGLELIELEAAAKDYEPVEVTAESSQSHDHGPRKQSWHDQMDEEQEEDEANPLPRHPQRQQQRKQQSQRQRQQLQEQGQQQDQGQEQEHEQEEQQQEHHRRHQQQQQQLLQQKWTQDNKGMGAKVQQVANDASEKASPGSQRPDRRSLRKQLQSTRNEMKGGSQSKHEDEADQNNALRTVALVPKKTEASAPNQTCTKAATSHGARMFEKPLAKMTKNREVHASLLSDTSHWKPTLQPSAIGVVSSPTSKPSNYVAAPSKSKLEVGKSEWRPSLRLEQS